MLASKKLTDFTNMFSPYDFDKNDHIILTISKMNESNSIETFDKTNLTKNQILMKWNKYNWKLFYQRD